jgi:rhodanese-related sulfurtransferase
MALQTASPLNGSVVLLQLPPSHEDAPAAVLQRARERAQARALAYAGDVTPEEALALASAGMARLIDVRTPEERRFVGYAPHSVHISWATGTAFTRNPRFLRELEAKARKDEVLLMLCRSGSRSLAAAEAATKGQFEQAFNVLEGFEGELNAEGRRNSSGGWKFRGLPWIQD